MKHNKKHIKKIEDFLNEEKDNVVELRPEEIQSELSIVDRITQIFTDDVKKTK